MDPLRLTPSRHADYLARPWKEKPEEFSFPEDLQPSCTEVDSSIPLMTLVNRVLELLQVAVMYFFVSRGALPGQLGS